MCEADAERDRCQYRYNNEINPCGRGREVLFSEVDVLATAFCKCDWDLSRRGYVAVLNIRPRGTERAAAERGPGMPRRACAARFARRPPEAIEGTENT